MWAMWRTRNKMTIEKKFPKSSTKVLFYGVSFLQRWEVLLKGDDVTRLQRARSQVLNVLHNFPVSNTFVSDVVEL